MWRRRRRKISKKSSAHYHAHKERARTLVHERLTLYSSFYSFTLRKVFIKNHRSRWGSCSQKGNLNFNYKLVFLPLPIVDYIIVHELCHLTHFNHGPEFWALVARAVPEHAYMRRQLRAIERKTNILYTGVI